MFVCFIIFTSFTGKQESRSHAVMPKVIWPTLVNCLDWKLTWRVLNGAKTCSTVSFSQSIMSHYKCSDPMH